MLTTLLLAAQLVQPLCAWNHPGADPTTSSVPATLHAMGIDSPELTAKIEAGDYSELVTVRREDRRTWGMTSGNAQWCAGEVDRHAWSDDHAEQGRVYRVPGKPAVVWYWRCKNMSLWLPAEAPATPAILPAEAFELPLEPTSTGMPAQALAAPAEGLGGTESPGAWFFPPAILGPIGGVAVCCGGPPPPVAGIPEPAHWLMLASGVLALWLHSCAQARRRPDEASRPAEQRPGAA